MWIRSRRDWEIEEREVTPEAVYRGRSRRDFLRLAGMGAAGLAVRATARAALLGFPDKRNPDFDGSGLRMTPLEYITGYNNFYEFGMDKEDPKENANAGWQPEPGWTVEIAGLADRTGKWDVEDLLGKLGGVEQRVYRHRCVEAWSMVVPWDGVPLRRLIAFAGPKADARFVAFTSFLDPKHAVGQKDGDIPYPYVEGLSLPEANHELAFLATGIYGKPLPNQNGAPWRLVVPWKYGFKGIKSIVRIEFVGRQPPTTWQSLSPDEYGFLANVNPHHDHPRWSQASERVIGAGFFGGRQPTLMFNGYEAQVAPLYRGVDLDRHF